MASFASRVRRFRSPVVVTVALGAMPGCGGKAEGGAVKPLTACPVAAPSQGTDCNYDGPDCEYDVCLTHPTKIAKCLDGAWRISHVSCNPPPPDRVCPDQVPAQHSPCDYQGPACEYGPDCLGRATQQALCTDNQWSVAQSTCNPPAPTSNAGANGAGAGGG